MVKCEIRESIARLEAYHVENADAEIIVNANESNLPLPAEAARDLAEKTAGFAFNRYPQMQAEDMCAILAESFNLAPENIICGNGSSELLRMACYVFGGSGKKIMVPVPSFSMYGVYVQLADSVACPYYLDKDGYIDKEALLQTAAAEKPALLILCNPNNPTGNYNETEKLAEIAAAVECPVIIDEAYIEFSGRESAVGLLAKYDNIICLRTFSKAYGLAGMRCGYGLGAAGLIEPMKKAMLPYGVNAYTLMTAAAVYAHKDVYAERIRQTVALRESLAECLRQLGFYVFASAANFVTFYAQEALAAKLAARYAAEYGCGNQDDRISSGKFIFLKLKENSILVRDYNENKNLRGCLRISIGLAEENERIAAVIKELCKDV